MTKQVWMSACVAVAFAGVGLAAQTTAGQTGQSTRSGKGSANTVTVTGCLKSGEQSGTAGGTTSGTATSGSTSASRSGSARGHFMLTNVQQGSSSTTGTTGTPSTTSGTSGTASSYMLEGRESELQKHVGHKVEITGTVESSKSGMSGSKTGSTTTGSESRESRESKESGSMGNAQRLRVQSVKMISSNCPGD
jgi:hypothetical protein